MQIFAASNSLSFSIQVFYQHKQSHEHKHNVKQESIPVGCLPPAYFNSHQISSALVGEGRCPEVNMFEQVSSDGHRMSLVG